MELTLLLLVIIITITIKTITIMTRIPNLDFLKGTLLGDKEQEVGIWSKVQESPVDKG